MKNRSNSIDLFDVEISLAMALQELDINPNPGLPRVYSTPIIAFAALFTDILERHKNRI